MVSNSTVFRNLDIKFSARRNMKLTKNEKGRKFMELMKSHSENLLMFA